MVPPDLRKKQAEEAAKHPTTTTTSTITIILSALPAAAERNYPPLRPPTRMNGQETKFYLSILSLTNLPRGHGTGFPNGPGQVSTTNSPSQYSLLGAGLCRMDT
jgi:hypothetical protein